MASFIFPITLPLSWQSARSAQFWAGQDRRIYARFYVSRPDGVTWEDLTGYLVSARISLGNVADVGTGNSGVDTGVRQATFELINERRPEITWDETLARDETYIVGDEADIVGDSADRGELFINKLFGATPKSYYAGDSLHPRDRNSSWNYWKGVYAPLLWPTREVILDVAAVPVGVTPGDADWVRIFHGFMGDSISASSDNGCITIECRDLMKRLQDCYIEQIRIYGSEAGTPAETVMQQIINDNITANPPQLYVPVSPEFMVKPYRCEYQSVADALWQIANQFGGWIGYRWIPDYNDFRLTLLIPPRGKDASSADWALDWTKDIYIQHLDISDRDVRNVLIITYRDAANGTRQSVTLEDTASIAEFGRRAMQIEEADTSLIDTAEEATALGQAVIHDLKGLTATTRINMPFMPTMDVFDGILVTNPRLSSTQDFYAVESVEHQLDFARGQFRTEIIGSGRVVGAHTKWLLMETRPGSPGEFIPKMPRFRLIVAAKDSPYDERRNADYFCDGVADQEQINAAVTALGVTGGEILLLKGTFFVNDSIVVNSNVALKGQGAATVIKLADNLATAVILLKNADVTNGNSNITLADFQIDGNKSNNTQNSYGIQLTKCIRCSINNVLIQNFRLDGVYLDTCSNCTLTGNYSLNNRLDGIYLTSSSRNTVSGNICKNNEGAGIRLYASSNNTVVANICENNASYGIVIYNSANNNTVEGNTIQENSYDGIRFVNSSYNTVSGNICQLNGNNGISLSSSFHNTIANNVCKENSQETHATYDNILITTNSDYNNIQNNICRRGSLLNQPRYGIRIDSSDCNSNLITNNDLYQAGATGNLSDAGTGTVTNAGNRIG